MISWLLTQYSAVILALFGHFGAPIDQGYLDRAQPQLDFIRDHLSREVKVPGGPALTALVETEKPIQNDVWYWTDDNAKALEAFLPPDAYARYKALADGMSGFILAMSTDKLILRRRAEERLEVVSSDPSSARLNTGLMNHHGPISLGRFFSSYKFHDNLTADAVSHAGNFVRVTLRGQVYDSKVEDNVTSATVIRAPEAVSFRMMSDVKVEPAHETVGQVEYAYTFRAGAPGIELTITFTPRGDVQLDNVEVSSSVILDSIDPRVRYSRLCAEIKAAIRCKNRIKDGPKRSFKGPIEIFSILQRGTAGFSYGLHFKALAGKATAVVTAARNGTLQHVYALYDLGRPKVGVPATARELRVLTSGGLYRDYSAYAELMRKVEQFSGIDLSVSYDYGAEINSMACYYMFSTRGLYTEPVPPDQLARIRVWLDHHIKSYRKNILVKVKGKRPYVFGRGLAFYALGLDCMWRATGESRYRKALKEAVEVLLYLRHDTEPAAPAEMTGGIRCDGNNSHLDCHAASLIALARASFSIDDPRLTSAITAGMRFFRTGDPVADEANARVRIDDNSLWVPINGEAAKPLDGTLWIFKAGLVLRATEAIKLAIAQGRIPKNSLLLDDVERVGKAATRQIGVAVRPRGNQLEFLTSFRSGETNSETQPWVSLGLVPIDPIIVQVRPPKN